MRFRGLRASVSDTTSTSLSLAVNRIFFPQEGFPRLVAQWGQKGAEQHPSLGDTSYQICLVVKHSP